VITALSNNCDVAIVGAGAAGLATAIFAARKNPQRRIVLLDGAKKLGAKILVSGGGRCNVTNVRVTPDDFRGGSPNIIRRVLNALPFDQTVAFFREIGVELHEEENGKLFPNSNKARTVLDALIREAEKRQIRILTDHRVEHIEKSESNFDLTTSSSMVRAKNIVLATGGLSLPKTGSNGAGYRFAQHLGHSLISTTPALDPLVLEGDFHQPLSGITQQVELTVRTEGKKPVSMKGSLLWTHFGISGPVVLNVSGLWHRAKIEGHAVVVEANLVPGQSYQSLETILLNLTATRPKLALRNVLAEWLPARVGDAVLGKMGLPGHIPLAHLSRTDRRRCLQALLVWPLPVIGGRGFAYAEVTAGGVPLDEIEPATMASRVCQNLYVVGEILDVDGRIGGFNFQWSWSSAMVAASALTAGPNG
jgi:predicted Rossmann fold flavoprotein